MKRNVNGTIYYKPTGIFRIETHIWGPDKNGILVKLLCPYEEVNVYTNSNNLVVAWKHHNYARAMCYKNFNESDLEHIVLDDRHHDVQQKIEELRKQYNPSHNCFGLCVLNENFWLDLTKENLETVLKGDKYSVTKSKPDVEHLIVYYTKNGAAVHIAKYDPIKKVYAHKMGCNQGVRTEDECVTKVYKYDFYKYYIIG